MKKSRRIWAGPQRSQKVPTLIPQDQIETILLDGWRDHNYGADSYMKEANRLLTPCSVSFEEPEPYDRFAEIRFEIHAEQQFLASLSDK